MSFPREFSLRGKILVLRHTTLGRIPPALYATQLLVESGIPAIVVEFGEGVAQTHDLRSAIVRLRFPPRLAPYFPAKLRPALGFFETLFRLMALIVRFGRPNLVASHGLQEQALAYALHSAFGVRFVAHSHEPFEAWELSPFNRFLFALEGPAFRRAELVIFPEKERREIYACRYGLTGATEVAFNCPRRQSHPTKTDLRRQLNLPAEAFVLGYLGGIGELNAPDLAIRSLAELPRVHFCLWGWGEASYLESLQCLARELGVIDRVHFLGELKEEKWAALAGLDAAYCVYRPMNLRARTQATASNKLFEAMAAGVPVVVGPGEDFREILRASPIGIALDDLSVSALQKALTRLLQNADEAKEMGALGRRLHEERYHFEKTFQMALERYRSFWSKNFSKANP